MLKRQAGVAFAPKDLRSSFITFLLSDANSDEALKKAVAQAMRLHAPLDGAAGLVDVRQGARRAHVGGGRASGGRVRRALRVRRAREAPRWGDWGARAGGLGYGGSVWCVGV